MATYTRRSPIHSSLELLKPLWIEVQQMQVPKHFGDGEAEEIQAKTLGLCDVSALRKLSIKGPDAAQWLATQDVTPPDKIYGWNPLSASGGRIMRISSNEFLLEDGIEGTLVPALKAKFSQEHIAAYSVDRQDAAFLLSGINAKTVMLQTCSIDFDNEPEHLVYSRIAGVSGAILHRHVNGTPVFRIWCKASYGVYLWEALREIVRDIGGAAVGLDSVRDFI